VSADGIGKAGLTVDAPEAGVLPSEGNQPLTKGPQKLARSLHTVKVLAKLALIYLETDPSARHAVESVTLQLGYRRDTPDPDCIKAKAVALLVGMGFEP